MDIWLSIWYRGGEEPYLHMRTNCQRNWMNNVNFTAHLMRVGSSVKSDNFTAYTDHTHTQHCPATRINTCINIWLIMWYHGREELFMHIHTDFQQNWTNNVNFTAHLIRVGSIVNFTAKTHRSHSTHNKNQYLYWHNGLLCGTEGERNHSCTFTPIFNEIERTMLISQHI